jgi:hypothetical protein
MRGTGTPMTTVGPDGRVRVGNDVHVREFDGELVILDLAKGDYFGINAVGAKVWERLKAAKSPREIAAELAPLYDVEEARLVEDFIALTDELVARGIVSRME